MERERCLYGSLSKIAVLGALLISTRVNATLMDSANPITGCSQISDGAVLMWSEPIPAVVWEDDQTGDYAMLLRGHSIQAGLRSDASLRWVLPRVIPPQLHAVRVCESVPETPSVFVASMLLVVPFGLQGLRRLWRQARF